MEYYLGLKKEGCPGIGNNRDRPAGCWLSAISQLLKNRISLI